MSEIYKNTLVLVDGDRTTLNTDRLQKELMRVVVNFGYNPKTLETEIAQAKARDGIYSPLDTLCTADEYRMWDKRSLTGESELRAQSEILRRITSAYTPIDTMKKRNLMPDAEVFLEELARTGVDFGIFTRGVKNWQRLKLVAAGIDSLPTKYTQESHKYEYINDCFDGEEFVINGFDRYEGKRYDTVVAIDDKEVNLDRLVEAAVGVHVLQDDRTIKDPLSVERTSGQPSNLVRVVGMRGVSAYFRLSEKTGGFHQAIDSLDKITTR